MATRICSSQPFFSAFNQHTLFSASALFFLSALCIAQETAQLPDAPVPQLLAQAAAQPQEPPPASSTNAPDIAIPAGTRLQLVLTHPVDSHTTPRGDDVFAQTTAPVIVGDQVIIPGGSYVQGKVEKLTRNGTRAEMQMQSVSLILPNGYIAQAGGPMKIESEEWTAWNNPHGNTKAGIILAPVLGFGLGLGIGAATDRAHTVTLTTPPLNPPPGFPPLPPLPPLAPLTMTENTHKGLAIGGMVGALAGGITALVLAAHNRQFYIQEASPMTMTLPRAITIPRAQVDQANGKAARESR